MRELKESYELQNINEIELDDFAPSNILWAVADCFPTKEYKETIEKLAPSGVANVDTTALNEWQEDEDPMDYIDRDAYNSAKFGFELSFDTEDTNDDEEIHCVAMVLHANCEEDVAHIQDIVDEVYCTRVKYLYGKGREVVVLTYNTRDNPERRMVAGVYASKELAKNAFEELKKNLGADFITDHEYNTKTLVE